MAAPKRQREQGGRARGVAIDTCGRNAPKRRWAAARRTCRAARRTARGWRSSPRRRWPSSRGSTSGAEPACGQPEKLLGLAGRSPTLARPRLPARTRTRSIETDTTQRWRNGHPRSNDAFDAATGVDAGKAESVVNLTGSRRGVLGVSLGFLALGLAGLWRAVAAAVRTSGPCACHMLHWRSEAAAAAGAARACKRQPGLPRLVLFCFYKF